MAARSGSRRLPNFPWDRLVPLKQRAAEHCDGLVDLSVGTPVDPTPRVVQEALQATADAPGYPTVWGTPALRTSIIGSLTRRLGSVELTDECVLPTIGSKELVASLPAQLGVHARHTVLVPQLAYPTYAVGALLAGAEYVASDATSAVGPADVPLVWVNSPANPTGRVLPVEHLRKVVAWARERGAVVASDECYLECAWDVEPVSMLNPEVNGGSLESILTVHSLSKRSNLAGYRAGFVAGDPALVTELLEVRKHAGLMVPVPVQAAMRAALDDDGHIEEQRQCYLRRRGLLRRALDSAGFRIDHSEASLYLWATRGEPCMETVEWLADRGILVAPGDFYGPAGGRHVRVAFTATDERVESAVSRLTN
ncbi:MAG: succinyldiaminopimelate transaminase [Propionibacteriales bacterium]|nr:succinyldiaminopimelate transaminase [Propionibacteriales bacterium]